MKTLLEIAKNYDVTVIDTSILLPRYFTKVEKHIHVPELLDVVGNYKVLTTYGVSKEFEVYMQEAGHVYQKATPILYGKLLDLQFELQRCSTNTSSFSTTFIFRKYVTDAMSVVINEIKTTDRVNATAEYDISKVDKEISALALNCATIGKTALCTSDRPLCEFTRRTKQRLLDNKSFNNKFKLSDRKLNLTIFTYIQKSDLYMDYEDYRKIYSLNDTKSLPETNPHASSVVGAF